MITSTRTIDPSALAPAERDAFVDQLLSIQAEVFDGVTRGQLQKYVVDSPAQVTEIELYEGEGGEALGYCTAHFFDQTFDGRPVVVMRMEAGLRRSVRGANIVGPFIARQILAWRVRNITRELYYLGSLVHPSSYMGLAGGFDETWPREGAAVPPDIFAFMCRLGDEFGLPRVDPSNPLLRDVGWITRDSEEEQDYWRNCRRPAARFFVETNPGYVVGHGLLTLISLGLGTIGRSLGAWGRKRFLAPIGRAAKALRDHDALSGDDVAGALERSRELQGVPLAALGAIMERSERVAMSSGAFVFHEGDRCSAFYVVISGSAYVLVGRDNPTLVDQMWEGEVFGDLAAFTGECRSASVRAATALTLLKVEKSAILDILQQHPEAAAVLWRNVARDRFDVFLRSLSPRFDMSRAERFAWFAEGRAAEQDESLAEAALLFLVVGTAEWQSGGRWQAVSAPALVSLDQAELHLADGARAWLLPEHKRGSAPVLGCES